MAASSTTSALEGLTMTRLVSLGLVAAVVCQAPAPSQPKDPPKSFTNSIGMKFAWVAPGSFLMGSPKGEQARDEHEVRHKVTLTRGFYLGAYPVTREQWQAVMGTTPGRPRRRKNLPVETVSWDDCQAFVQKLRQTEGRPYRLPTEAEWEYACRAGTTTPYAFGQTLSPQQANFGKFRKGASPLATTPVGRYPANAWGLYDMHGNVWEWCQDWLGEYPRGPVVDPRGNEGGVERVLRGGSWNDIAANCRSARRHSFRPGGRDHTVGFRVCFTPD
jgi:formylglycine-generating enzyme required for sulfatase activity